MSRLPKHRLIRLSDCHVKGVKAWVEVWVNDGITGCSHTSCGLCKQIFPDLRYYKLTAKGTPDIPDIDHHCPCAQYKVEGVVTVARRLLAYNDKLRRHIPGLKILPS